MRLKTLSGREAYRNTAKFRIRWENRSLSKMQKSVKDFLRPYWEGFVCYEEFPVFGTKMRLDLFNATRMIAIEVNGDQHREFTPFFHNNSNVNYFRQIKRDDAKERWCEINGIKLVQIYKEDIPLKREFFTRMGIPLV